MAHKKGAGSSKNGRDSISKRLGIKLSTGSFVKSGQILVKQNGFTFKAGLNVGFGKDYTLFAKATGFLFYKKSKNFGCKVFITN